MALEQRVAVLEVRVERLLTLLEEQDLLPEGGADFVFDVPVPPLPRRPRARSRSPRRALYPSFCYALLTDLFYQHVKRGDCT